MRVLFLTSSILVYTFQLVYNLLKLVFDMDFACSDCYVSHDLLKIVFVTFARCVVVSAEGVSLL